MNSVLNLAPLFLAMSVQLAPRVRIFCLIDSWRRGVVRPCAKLGLPLENGCPSPFVPGHRNRMSQLCFFKELPKLSVPSEGFFIDCLVAIFRDEPCILARRVSMAVA